MAIQLTIQQKYKDFGIDENLVTLCHRAEQEAATHFKAIEAVREYNQLKVIQAMQKNRVSETHFHGSTGYGYGDTGREMLDRVFADIFGAEDVLVRSTIASGTHAIFLAMAGNLKPGDELLSITGSPYETIASAIGVKNDADQKTDKQIGGQTNGKSGEQANGKANGTTAGSLIEQGIHYNQIELKDRKIDIECVLSHIKKHKTKMCFLQRSRGYAWREAFTITEIGEAIAAIKKCNPEVIVLVDNCYGEFTDTQEPTEVGADMIAGSLIKNPGGGLALAGGYVAGKTQYVEMASYRHTCPGLGREIGATFGLNRNMFQGIYFAPHVVGESLKGAVFCAKIMELLGYPTLPACDAKRSDIIQAIQFRNEKELIAFCQGIQKGSAIDSFVVPHPWEMPGYQHKVIMAAGAFVQGSSIEMSADAPIKEPYIAYFQGGLVYESVKIGVLAALSLMGQEHPTKFD